MASLFLPCVHQGFVCFPRFWLDLTPSDVMWNTADTGWAKSAWSSIFSPWIQGACVFTHYLPRFESTYILQVRQSLWSTFKNVLMVSLIMQVNEVICRNQIRCHDLRLCHIWRINNPQKIVVKKGVSTFMLE